MSFEWSCRNIRLEGPTLHVECRRIDGSYRPSSLPLDTILENVDGTFKWGNGNFSSSANNVRLEGNILKGNLQGLSGAFTEATLSLSSNIVNVDGILKAVNLPMIIAIPKESQQVFENQLAQAIDKNPNLKIQAGDEKDGSTVWYVNAAAKVDGTFFNIFTAHARAFVMRIVQSKGKKVEQVNIDVFSANASFTMSGITDSTAAGFSLYIGVDANLSLFKA
ncbi:hypothetical protein MMC14_008838 [Varicellaria rhodocarpa]|nr:hypothetical protein [Varicellaria rhodocarpa]